VIGRGVFGRRLKDSARLPDVRFVRRVEVLLSSILAAWFLAIYAPSVGHGFLRDDYVWIAESSVSSLNDLRLQFFHPPGGFYRPLVSLSFAANRALFGVAPLPYAMSNLLLLALCATAVYMLARAFRRSLLAGLAAAGVWLLNPHGINTTLLWMSGRTALLLTLFATLSAVAFKRGRSWLAAALSLLAMLSKEEAVVLPFMFAVWAALDRESERRATPLGRVRQVVAASWIPFLALVVYAVLRHGSGAMTPGTAPSGYRFTFAGARVARNILEYTNRTCMFSAALVCLMAVTARRRPTLGLPRQSLAQLLTWILGLYALTLFLPVRSGLYAVAPSVAVAILAGAFIANLVAAVDARAQRRVWIVLVATAVITIPMYRARNAPDTRRAILASAVLRQVAPVAKNLPAGSLVVIHDHRDGAATMEDAFGTLTSHAVALASGRRDVTVWLDPTPFDLRVAGVRAPNDADAAAVFVVQHGELRRLR